LGDFPSVVLFDPTPLFCDSNWCYGTKNNNKLYKDYDHLSDYGSAYLAKYLSPVILKTLK
jgi:hypothetical protein